MHDIMESCTVPPQEAGLPCHEVMLSTDDVWCHRHASNQPCVWCRSMADAWQMVQQVDCRLHLLVLHGAVAQFQLRPVISKMLTARQQHLAVYDQQHHDVYEWRMVQVCMWQHVQGCGCLSLL